MLPCTANGCERRDGNDKQLSTISLCITYPGVTHCTQTSVLALWLRYMEDEPLNFVLPSPTDRSRFPFAGISHSRGVPSRTNATSKLNTTLNLLTSKVALTMALAAPAKIVDVSAALTALEPLGADQYCIAFGPGAMQFCATPNGYST
jgi:hypothetical protein